MPNRILNYTNVPRGYGEVPREGPVTRSTGGEAERGKKKKYLEIHLSGQIEPWVLTSNLATPTFLRALEDIRSGSRVPQAKNGSTGRRGNPKRTREDKGAGGKKKKKRAGEDPDYRVGDKID